MKRIYLSALLLACVQTPAYALLNVNGVLGQVNNVTRQLDATAEQIKRKTERDLEQLKLDKLVDSTGNLIDPLLKLPEQLPIKNTSGQTAFVDVQVENGWRAVQHEWLVMLDENELATLQQLPIEVLEKTHFDELDLTLIRFRVPAELDSFTALKKQLPASIVTRLDRNHIYAAQAEPAPASESSATTKPVCNESVKIGMIDTAIKIDHPAFATNGASKIISRDFLEEKLTPPDAHGTAVAGLLIGKGENLNPLLPNASLYSASVFYARNDYAQGATMLNLVRALNWLMAENVSVINMSLAGPDNQILAKVIAKALSSGKAIVAAVGNEGPAAPPMFPAAYAGVIAVTAVDREQKIYRWANRGNQVAFAAQGVSVITARASGGFGRESGTSMASPVVAAFVSCELHNNKINLADAFKHLSTQAIDLGVPGRDDIFGYGLLDNNK
jgi:minor extracellular protease Epr